MCVHATVCVWGQRTTRGILSFHHAKFWDQNQVMGLSSKHLYPLRHLVDPTSRNVDLGRMIVCTHSDDVRGKCHVVSL